MMSRITLIIVLCLLGMASIISVGYADENGQPRFSTLTSKVEWGQTGQYIVVGTWENGLSIYEATSRNLLIHIPYSETGAVVDLALSPDETMIVARGETEQSVKIWDTSSGQLLHILQTDVGTLSFAWSSNGRWFASAGTAGTRVWNVSDGQTLFHIPARAEDTPKIAFSQDDKLAISWSGLVDIWDISTQQRIKRVLLSGLRASVQWGSDNLHMLMPTTSILQEGTFHTIKIWNVDTEQVTQEFSGFPDRLTSAYWSPDESKILSTSFNGQVYITDVTTGETKTLMSVDERVLSAAWSPYGGQVAVGIPLGTEVRLEADTFLSSMDTTEGIAVIVPTMTLEQLQIIANRCAISAQQIAQVDWDALIDNLLTQDNVSEALQQLEALPPNTRNACIDDLIAVAEAIQRR